MLWERARRALLRDISEAAKRLLQGLATGDDTIVVEAVASAREYRADMTDDYRCPMRESFDQIELGMQTAAASRTNDDARALRAAVSGATGFLVGALATGTTSRVTELGGGVREVVAGEPQRIVYEVELSPSSSKVGLARPA